MSTTDAITPNPYVIDSSWLDRPAEGLPSTFKTDKNASKRLLAQREAQYFEYHDLLTQWRRGHLERGQKQTKTLETVSKVVSVVIAALSVLIPLAAWYLPAWVPWGIGLPLSIVFMIVKGKVVQRLENRKHETAFVPLFGGFLENRSGQSPRVIGKEDIPAVDKRLRSDLLKQDALAQYRPSISPPPQLAERYDLNDQSNYLRKRVGGLADRLNLENTPLLQQGAALEYAHYPVKQDKWQEVVISKNNIQEAAKRGDRHKFGEAVANSQQLAYESRNFGRVKIPSRPLADYPSNPSVRDHLANQVSRYNQFARQLHSLEALHEAGKTLYDKTSHTAWAPFIEKVRHHKTILESYNTSEVHTRLDALELNPDLTAECTLYQLIHEARTIKLQLEVWIAAHPSKRYQALKESLKGYAATSFSKLQLNMLSTWMTTNPRAINQKLNSVRNPPDFVKTWLDQHPHALSNTVQDLFNQAFETERLLTYAQEKFKEVNFNNPDQITAFETQMMPPLSQQIAQLGGTSKFQQVMQTIFKSSPPTPFEKPPLPKAELPLRARLIEERCLNRRLQRVDQKMLKIHWIHKGCSITPIIFFAIEGIVMIYFSNPWIWWGIALFSVGLQGVLYLLERRLKDQERRKERVKLESILRDYPDVRNIPGTQPELKALQEVQKRYALEGVRSTWARLLTEEGDTSAETFVEIAKEGSAKATPYLQDALLALNIQYERNSQQLAKLRSQHHQKPDQERKEQLEAYEKYCNEIKQQMESIEKTLYPEALSKKQKDGTPPNIATYKKERAHFKAFAQLTQQRLLAIESLTYLDTRKGYFDALAEVFPPGFLDQLKTVDEMQAYLDTVTDRQWEDAEQACHVLEILQQQEQPTLAAVQAQRQKIEGDLAQIATQRIQMLNASPSSFYESLTRERAQVDAALNEVVEEKIYLEAEREKYSQKWKAFSKLYQQIGAEFASQPVLQAEIDLLLESLKWEQLAPQPNANHEEALASIRDKFSHFPLSLVSTRPWEVARAETEIAVIRTLPAAERLTRARLLRKLQLLQSDEDYQNLSHVNSKCAQTELALEENERALKLLQAYNKQLQEEIEQTLQHK
jgi:hypothetical protein